jgi:hypothetical protein
MLKGVDWRAVRAASDIVTDAQRVRVRLCVLSTNGSHFFLAGGRGSVL